MQKIHNVWMSSARLSENGTILTFLLGQIFKNQTNSYFRFVTVKKRNTPSINGKWESEIRYLFRLFCGHDIPCNILDVWFSWIRLKIFLSSIS